MSKVKLFYSYSEVDERYRVELEKSFSMLRRYDSLFEWNFRKIYAGKDWDKVIHEELLSSNIILFLVSRDFLASAYCHDIEVKLAMELHDDKKAIVVPIILRECDWKHSKSLFKHLEVLPQSAIPISQWLDQDSAYNNITQRIKELINSIQNLANSTVSISSEVANTSFLNSYPNPTIIFTGREDKLNEFNEYLKKFNILVVEGLGGIGKTEFVAKAIEKFVSKKENVIWYDGSSTSQFEVFVESVGYGDILKGENKSKQSLFSAFKDILEKHHKLLVLDNYHVLNNDFVDFVKFSIKYLSNSKIVLITKVDPLFHAIPIISLDGLESDAIEYANKLNNFLSSKKYEITDIDIANICRSTLGHPLAIQLAMQLMHYGVSSDKIIQEILKFKGRKDVEELAKRLFSDIFNHSATTIAEQQLLMKVSIFQTKVKKEALREIFKPNDVEIPLSGLIDKLLLTARESYYELHPLIKGFSYELLEEKEITHFHAAEFFMSQRGKELQPVLEEQIIYHLIESRGKNVLENEVIVNGRKYINEGQHSLLRKAINYLIEIGNSSPIHQILLGDIFQIQGDWELAKSYFEKASIQELDYELKAEAILKVGEILFRQGFYEMSLKYFEEALDFTSEKSLPKSQARAFNDVGLVNKIFGEFQKSEECFLKAIKIRTEILDDYGLADSLTNIGSLYSNEGDFEKAFLNCNTSVNIYTKLADKYGIGLSLNNLAVICMNMGDVEKGLYYLKKSLDIKSELGDKQGIANYFSNTSIALFEKGKTEEALEKAQIALRIDQEIGDQSGEAICLINIADAYSTLEKYDLAIENAEKSLAINKKVCDKQGISQSLIHIGAIYQKKEKFEDAISIYESALIICEEINNRPSISTIHNNLGSIYQNNKKKEYEKAIYHLL